MKYIKYFLIITIAFMMSTCSNDGSKKSEGMLAEGSGRPGEMILVMDSAKWAGPLGDAIRATFRTSIEGLPRDEYSFDVNHVDPRKLNHILKAVKNLVFVLSLEGNSPGTQALKRNFSDNSLKQMHDNPKLFVKTEKNVYSKNQSVMYLFGPDDATLTGNIKQNSGSILEYFNNAEKERLEKSLYRSKEQKGIARMMTEKYGASLRVPVGYEIAVMEDDFFWVRNMEPKTDKNIFVTFADYTSVDIFKRDELVIFRDNIIKKHLFADPDKLDSYMITETEYVPVISDEISFNDKFAIESRGLWKTNNLAMGGPFVSYAMVDEETNRLFYIEGFSYSPSTNKREIIRELEIILSTFRLNSELNAGNKG